MTRHGGDTGGESNTQSISGIGIGIAVRGIEACGGSGGGALSARQAGPPSHGAATGGGGGGGTGATRGTDPVDAACGGVPAAGRVTSELSMVRISWATAMSESSCCTGLRSRRGAPLPGGGAVAMASSPSPSPGPRNPGMEDSGAGERPPALPTPRVTGRVAGGTSPDLSLLGRLARRIVRS